MRPPPPLAASPQARSGGLFCVPGFRAAPCPLTLGYSHGMGCYASPTQSPQTPCPDKGILQLCVSRMQTPPEARSPRAFEARIPLRAFFSPGVLLPGNRLRTGAETPQHPGRKSARSRPPGHPCHRFTSGYNPGIGRYASPTQSPQIFPGQTPILRLCVTRMQTPPEARSPRAFRGPHPPAGLFLCPRSVRPTRRGKWAPSQPAIPAWPQARRRSQGRRMKPNRGTPPSPPRARATPGRISASPARWKLWGASPSSGQASSAA